MGATLAPPSSSEMFGPFPQTSMPFQLRSIEDIAKHGDAITSFASKHADVPDFVVRLAGRPQQHSLGGEPALVVAGSAAMAELYRRVPALCSKDSVKASKQTTAANDTDIFLLGRERPFRQQILGGRTDFVAMTCKTVAELLMSFDLPCCRVALSPIEDEWFISWHCLLALLTGTYPLPQILQTSNSLLNAVRHPVVDADRDLLLHRWQRTAHRISKYDGRGFKVTWVQAGDEKHAKEHVDAVLAALKLNNALYAVTSSSFSAPVKDKQPSPQTDVKTDETPWTLVASSSTSTINATNTLVGLDQNRTPLQGQTDAQVVGAPAAT